MKFIIAVSAFVAAVAAQDMNSLNDCGKKCVSNMVGIANTQFGCANGDVKCYCTNPEFAKGLAACSVEACGADQQSKVIAYGTAYCANAGSGSGSSSSGTATGTASGTASTGAGASASSVASSASSAVSSAASSASAAVSSVASSASGAAASASSAASKSGSSAAGGATGTGSASGSGAMRTAAPFAGALGLAMLFV